MTEIRGAKMIMSLFLIAIECLYELVSPRIAI